MKADLARYGIQYDAWFFESTPVYYTHLDVYKRQLIGNDGLVDAALGKGL